jgi:hypothetical protein
VFQRSITSALSIILAAALFVAGCSSLPTSPPNRAGAAPAVLGFDPPESAPADEPATGAVRPVSSSVYVRAVRGGTVTAGDFSVVIPPLALTGDAIVTVCQPDPAKPEVKLSITPEERNGFRVPVTLFANCGDHLDRRLLSLSYMSWWNPAIGAWERVDHSSVSVLDLTVQAPLSHFSTYRVERDGRAGW